MGSAIRSSVAVLVALFGLVLAGSASAAVSQTDAHGTVLIDGNKVFPIVLAKGPERNSTTPNGSDALDEVVDAGVNVFKVGPASDPWLDPDKQDAVAWDDEAAQRGVYTWVNLATLADATPQTPVKKARLREVIDLLKDDPALAMWKGMDEPWWAKFLPPALQYAYCVSTSRGEPTWCGGEPWEESDHLWVTIQAPRGTAEDLAPYSAVTDVHGVDDYPVVYDDPDPNLHEVGEWTHTIASVTPNQAVWTTVQVCASGSSGPSPGQFVLPTLKQERYMIYDAILNGARSLAFYGGNIDRCWNATDTEHGWNWTFWDTVLKELVQEINADSPIAPALVDPDSTKVLASSDATTQVISRDGANGDLWVIAARSGEGPTPVTISGLPPERANGAVYTEGRSVTATGGAFTDVFDRWDVHVYRFPAPPPPPAPPPVSPPPPPAAPPPPPLPVNAVPATRDVTAPGTRITAAPSRRTKLRRARFRFVSTERGSLFQCRLDRGRWLSCQSPKAYRSLRKGVHVFRVRARDAAGNADPTPAVRSWRVR
jgi:hypothetical protein